MPIKDLRDEYQKHKDLYQKCGCDEEMFVAAEAESLGIQTDKKADTNKLVRDMAHRISVILANHGYVKDKRQLALIHLEKEWRENEAIYQRIGIAKDAFIQSELTDMGFSNDRSRS